MTAVVVLVESNTTGTGRLFCRAVRRLGLRPVLLAQDPARYPYVAEDGIDSVVADTTTTTGVLAACEALDAPIAGVTSSSEYYVATAAEAAATYGLLHPDPEAIRGCRDKHRQRARLVAAGIVVPGNGLVRTPAAAVTVAERIGLPVVVKPVAGSGSIATRLCTSPAEVRAAAAVVLEDDIGLGPQDAVLVEQYLDGPEYSVETLDDQVVGVTAKHLGPAPYFVETGHDFPAPLPPGIARTIGAAAVAALRALGLGRGPAHTELRLTAAGPRIVEVNPRLAGGMIPRLVEEALGIDLIHHVVAAVAGRATTPRPVRSGAASIRFLLADRPGRLVEIGGVDDALAVPGVVEVAITPGVAPGRDVVPQNSFKDRLAAVIAADTDGGVAAAAATKGLGALTAVVDSSRRRRRESTVGGAGHDQPNRG